MIVYMYLKFACIQSLHVASEVVIIYMFEYNVHVLSVMNNLLFT